MILGDEKPEDEYAKVESIKNYFSVVRRAEWKSLKTGGLIISELNLGTSTRKKNCHHNRYTPQKKKKKPSKSPLYTNITMCRTLLFLFYSKFDEYRIVFVDVIAQACKYTETTTLIRKSTPHGHGEYYSLTSIDLILY